MRHQPEPRRSIRRHLAAGIGIVVLLAGGVGGWGSTAQLAGAVIAKGSVAVDSNVKKVQHLTGGTVGELRVREGDVVRVGDVVVRLDDTVIRANLAIVNKGLDEFVARKARLESERDAQERIKYPDEMLARRSNSDVAHLLAGESRLFELRRSARQGQKAQYRERIQQLQQEVGGLIAQQDAKEQELALIGRELAAVKELWSKKLIQLTRLIALEREQARLLGERGQLVATTAQIKGKIAEIELQIIQVDQDLSSDVAKELRELEGKIGEFVERKVAAMDQLNRTEIRAPQDGTVLQLTVHTVGGVIAAGDPIMLIVPSADNLIIEAKVNPEDIDQLKLEQGVLLRFSAFNARTTPEIGGKVMRISADAPTDQRTGQSYYMVRIAMPANEIARLGNVKLIPGMPVEVFFQTAERTMLSYFMKPLQDQFVRAFKEK
jgi:membrane fusion protein, type I secretion system